MINNTYESWHFVMVKVSSKLEKDTSLDFAFSHSTLASSHVFRKYLFSM